MKKKKPLGPRAKEKGLINIIVETHKGSRNKYAFDTETNLLTLKKVLPAGMAFPFDFGCIPCTRGDDGDPLDVLVLMEAPVCPPCIVQGSLIGVIEAEQSDGKEFQRNDRLVAVTSFDNQPSEERSIKKLDAQILKEIERFFVSYNELAGKKFKVLNYRGPKVAKRLLKNGERKFRKGD